MKARSIISGLSGLLLILIFLGGIWLPLVHFLLGIEMESTLVENRLLASPPDAPNSLAAFERFPREFEAYYNDHFGFRNTLIYLYNLIQVKLLGNSTHARVIIGDSGWLYLNDQDILEDYRGLEPFTEKQLRILEAVLEERREWLEQRGIEYVVVIAPNKHTIYPEYLPDYIKRAGPKTRVDQLREHMEAHSKVRFIDLGIELRKVKHRDRLYHRTDSHWNDRGAFFASQAIMAHLSDRFPALAPFPESLYVCYTQKAGSRNLARMVGLQKLFNEELIKCEPRRRFPVRKLKTGLCPTYDMPRQKTLQPFAFVQKSTDRPSAVVFRDSFFSNLTQYVAPYFRRSVYYWQYELDRDVIEFEKPDIVIQEIVERELMLIFPK